MSSILFLPILPCLSPQPLQLLTLRHRCNHCQIPSSPDRSDSPPSVYDTPSPLKWDSQEWDSPEWAIHYSPPPLPKRQWYSGLPSVPRPEPQPTGSAPTTNYPVLNRYQPTCIPSNLPRHVYPLLSPKPSIPPTICCSFEHRAALGGISPII